MKYIWNTVLKRKFCRTSNIYQTVELNVEQLRTLENETLQTQMKNTNLGEKLIAYQKR